MLALAKRRMNKEMDCKYRTGRNEYTFQPVNMDWSAGESSSCQGLLYLVIIRNSEAASWGGTKAPKLQNLLNRGDDVTICSRFANRSTLPLCIVPNKSGGVADTEHFTNLPITGVVLEHHLRPWQVSAQRSGSLNTTGSPSNGACPAESICCVWDLYFCRV